MAGTKRDQAVSTASTQDERIDEGELWRDGEPLEKAYPEIPSGNENPTHERPKLGGKCCGCCCDFRMAVIIVDLIAFILSVLGLSSIAVSTGGYSRTTYAVAGNNGKALDILDEIITANAILCGVGIVAVLVPLLGALKCNSFMVLYGAIWFVFQLVASIIIDTLYISKADNTADVRVTLPWDIWAINAIITGLFIYPHVSLSMEIKKGVITHETYPRKHFSCFCT